MKVGYLFLTAFLIAFGIVLFGEAGLVSAYKKSQENAKLEARIAVLQKENTKLNEDISSIKTSSRMLEHTIRMSLSLVAPDEILFDFQ